MKDAFKTSVEIIQFRLFKTSTKTVMFVAFVSFSKKGLIFLEKSLYESLLIIKPFI